MGGAQFSGKDQYVGTGDFLLTICNYGASISGGKSDVSSEVGAHTYLSTHPPHPEDSTPAGVDSVGLE